MHSVPGIGFLAGNKSSSHRVKLRLLIHLQFIQAEVGLGEGHLISLTINLDFDFRYDFFEAGQKLGPCQSFLTRQ